MDECGRLPQLGYGEFSEWLHRRVGNQRIPISGTIEVTQRCNLRCQHCYIPTADRSRRKADELSLAEIQRILDEVTDAGCLWMLLTGGEPLMRRDLLDIYTYAKRKGLIVTLFTNGTLLTPRIVDYLAEWRPFYVEITLYGATQETYERVTGIPGSYTRCRHGIELLLDRKIPFGLKTMVMTLNQHELGQMKGIASELGVRFRTDGIVTPAINHSNRPILYRITPQDVVALDLIDAERSKLWRVKFQENERIPISNTSVYLCGAGKQGFHIDSTAQLSLCSNARQSSYDLRQGNFQEGWGKFLLDVINRQHSTEFACLGCDLRRVCNQCYATADLETGDGEKKVDFLCQITNLRRDVFSNPK